MTFPFYIHKELQILYYNHLVPSTYQMIGSIVGKVLTWILISQTSYDWICCGAIGPIKCKALMINYLQKSAVNCICMFPAVHLKPIKWNKIENFLTIHFIALDWTFYDIL